MLKALYILYFINVAENLHNLVLCQGVLYRGLIFILTRINILLNLNVVSSIGGFFIKG